MAHLRCPATGWTTDVSSTHFRGPTGEPLEVVHDYPKVSRELFDSRLARVPAPYDSGVWRFKELIYPDLPLEHVVSRPEGNTAIYRTRQVSAYTGVADLGLKHEGMNPTGSFKDRGMTVATSQAKANGARAVVCASTGNTSAAVASYAALAGIPAVILVPEGKTAMSKLTQSIAYGAKTVAVRGDFDAAMALVQQASKDLGFYLLNSLNPFRVEGQKAIMLEMLQQLAWNPPDWVVFPAGNLGNTSAFGRALVLAREVGLIDRLPRLLAVQAEGASPFAKAYARGFDQLVPESAETVATAIRIGDPVSYNRAIESIRATNGHVISVTDRQIMEAKAVVDASGVGAEPASCATVAGLKAMVEAGVVDPGARVIGILTGNLLKDPDTTLAWHRGDWGDDAPLRNPPVTIDPTIEALAALVQA